MNEENIEVSETEKLEEEPIAPEEPKEEEVDAGQPEEPSEPAPEPEPEPQPVPEEGAPAPEPKVAEEPVPEGNPTPEPVKTFTQDEVNKMIGRAREEGRSAGYKKAHMDMLGRYGVDNDDELDGLFADGSRYGEQSARYDDINMQLRDANAQLALLRSGVVPERQGDAKAILAANGLEVTEEAIASLIPTHPEWLGNPQQNQVAPAPEIPQPKPQQAANPDDPSKAGGVMGAEPTPSKDEENEEDMAMRVYGLGGR